jgi:hypothetical protein
MAFTYILICIFDFIVFPTLMLSIQKTNPTTPQWSPLTLVESGLFHISMGAILGVSAYTRGIEKIESKKER